MQELDGRSLRVNAGPPPPKRDDFSPRGGAGGSRGGGPGFGSSNRVHVGNLSWKVDDAALKTLFSELGDVVEAKVIYDRDSGRSRGFGFVTYNSADEVNSAIESLDGVVRASICFSLQKISSYCELLVLHRVKLNDILATVLNITLVLSVSYYAAFFSHLIQIFHGCKGRGYSLPLLSPPSRV